MFRKMVKTSSILATKLSSVRDGTTKIERSSSKKMKKKKQSII